MPHSPGDGDTWCFCCSLGSQSGLDHRQEAASPELPSLLWCPPAGPTVGMLVFGAVRRAGCVALASLGPSGLCPSQPEGVWLGAPGPDHGDRQNRCGAGTSAGPGIRRGSAGGCVGRHIKGSMGEGLKEGLGTKGSEPPQRGGSPRSRDPAVGPDASCSDPEPGLCCCLSSRLAGCGPTGIAGLQGGGVRRVSDAAAPVLLA